MMNHHHYAPRIGLILLALLTLAVTTEAGSAEVVTAITRQRVHPVVIRNQDNALLSLTVTCEKPYVLMNSITVSLDGCDDLADVESLQFYFSNENGVGMLV
jgi:hypothetical protein